MGIKEAYQKMQKVQDHVNYYDEPTNKDEIWDSAYNMGLDCAMAILEEECPEVLDIKENA